MIESGYMPSGIPFWQVWLRRIIPSRSAGWLMLALILIQLPFIVWMPFHVDDPVFIHTARQIDADPLLPMNHPVIFEGRLFPNHLSYSHPPLACYYLWLLEKISFGYFEAAAHAGFLIFWLLFTLAVWKLAVLAGVPPMAAALLAALSPGVWVSSHTVMMDLPALALGTAGLAAALNGLQTDRRRLVWLGGWLVALGCLMSYSTGFHLLPAAVYALVRRRFWRNLLPLALPAGLLLGGWLALVFLVSGQVPFLDLHRYMAAHREQNLRNWDRLLIYNLVAIGGGLLVPCLLRLITRRWLGLAGRLGTVLFFWAGMFWVAPDYSGFQRLVLALLAAGAVWLLAGFLRRQTVDWRARHPKSSPLAAALLAWTVICFSTGVLLFPHGAIRYQLWITAPLAIGLLQLLAGRTSADRQPGRAISRQTLAAALVLQLIPSLLAAAADLDLARGFRSLVQETVRRYQAPGQTVWAATDWGLRYYTGESGGRTLLRYDVRPRPGDVVLQPVQTGTTYQIEYDQEPWGRLEDEINIRATLPVRNINYVSRAGFYSDWWGLLPFWHGEPANALETVRIYRVLQSLPPDPERERVNRGFYDLPPDLAIPR